MTRISRTQLNLLKAGADLFLKSMKVEPLSGISLDSIAASAGYNRSTIYRLWQDKNDYLRDLTAYMAGGTNYGDEHLSEGVDEAIAAGAAADPLEALLAIAEADLNSLRDNDQWLAMEVLITGHVAPRKEFVAPAVAGYEATDDSTYDWYDSALRRMGRVPRRPLTAKHIGIAVQAMAEGAAIRQLLQPDIFTSPVGPATGRRGVYPLAIASLLLLVTAAPGDERSLMQVLEDGFQRRDESEGP